MTDKVIVNILFIIPQNNYGGAERQLNCLVDNIETHTASRAKIFDCKNNDSQNVNCDLLLENIKNRNIRNIIRLKNYYNLYRILLRKTDCTFVFYNSIFLPVAYLLKITNRTVYFSIREYDETYFAGWKLFILKRLSSIYTNTETVSKRFLSKEISCRYFHNEITIPPVLNKGYNQKIIKGDILLVSNVEPHKEIHTVIKAFENKNVNLIICGKTNNSDYFDYCVKLSKELKVKVDFLGMVDKASLNILYNTCSVFIHPSIKEGVSNAIIDALLAGIPILISDINENLALANSSYLNFKAKNKNSLALKYQDLLDEDNKDIYWAEFNKFREHLITKYTQSNLSDIHEYLLRY